jgi:hypothetical protein
LRQVVHHLVHRRVGLAHGLTGVVDEADLNLIPARASTVKFKVQHPERVTRRPPLFIP